jgi:hypothetical protein
MAAEIDAALLHFDQDNRLPDKVGERGATDIGASNTHFERRAGLSDAALSERLKEPIEIELCFALLIAGDVRGAPSHEVGQALAAIIVEAGHGVLC